MKSEARMKGGGELRLYVTVAAAPGLNWADNAVPAVQGLLSNLDRASAELVVDLDSGSGQALEERLRRESPGDVRFWVDGRSLSELQTGCPPLVSGAVIVATPIKGAPPHRAMPTGLELTFSVLSGPDTGSMQALKRGKYSIGRTTADLHIADPQLSRLHAELMVEPTSIRIDDRGSANGTSIDRHKIESSLVSTASHIEMGSSICGLRFSSEFQDLSAPTVDPSEPLLVHREPATQRRGAMLLMALLPVAVGVGLALITGMWMFLAFSAMSALTMLIPVLGGRKRRKRFNSELEAANEADAARRRAATPSVAEILRYTFHQARQHHSAKNRPAIGRESTADGSVLAGWIRLGIADQAANVTPDPADRDFVPSLLHRLPVALNLAELRHIAITGDSQQVCAMVRSLVIQISSWSTNYGHRLMLYGPLTDLSLETRFLPQAELIQAPEELRAALDAAVDDRIVLFLARTAALSDDLAPLLQQETAAERLTIIWYGEEAPQGAIPTVALLRGSAILRNTAPVLEFVPDLVQPMAFERYCRSKGKLVAQSADAAGAKSSVLPKMKSLDSLIDTAQDQIRKHWALSDSGTSLEGPIGVGAAGDVSVDLQRDGPHLLLAGTTGSGKSELLRTLILSLCMNHSPRLVNFLLIDFKGGSGLGPLRKLPHSVGLLTDLSAESVERAMASLRAEIRRREFLFTQVEAGDIASYRKVRERELEEVPNLVVVIDEFRMLLEEVPAAMDELLRIASLGRSLGLHLIMATQRPQGAISADIRANITTSISLRVQTATESQDILDSSEAAGISIDLPGRAYLKRSGEPARQFQSASSSVMSTLNDPIRMCLLEDFLPGTDYFKMDRGTDDAEAALQGYIRAAVDAWKADGRPLPRHPVLPDLPEHLDNAMAGARPQAVVRQDPAACAHPEVSLGLLDLPALQQQAALKWRPLYDAHLALIGGPRSGVNGTMRNLMAQLLDCSIAHIHLYVLDGDAVLPGLERNAQVGAYVSGDDIRRATRVIQRLVETVSERLAAGQTFAHRPAAVDAVPDDSPSVEPPTLVLAVTGWGRWLSAIRNSPWPWAEEAIQDLVRDGGKVGVAVVIGGDRELVTARMFGNIENRLFLPTGASAESLMVWPRLPIMKRTPGRAYVEGRIAPHPGIAQLIACNDSEWAQHCSNDHRDSESAVLPFRIDALPRMLGPADLPDPPADSGDILVGVQGDRLDPAVIRVPPGSVYVVLGGPRSGKTTTLEMLARQGPTARHWIWGTEETLEEECIKSTSSEYRPRPLWKTAQNVPTTILVDDADQLSPQAQQKLVHLHSKGFGVIMSAALGPTAMSRIPLASIARAAGSGMVLMPRSTFDGEFFGIRLDPEPAPPSGRAAIVEGGRWQEAQLVQISAMQVKP